MNLPLPSLQRLIVSWHQLLALNINDPATNYGQSEPFTAVNSLLFLAPHEDFVGSPLHWLLGGVALLWIMLRAWRRSDGVRTLAIGQLALLTLASGLLFCLLLKWQPWGNRLFLGIVMLYSPVSACWLASLNRPGWRWLQRLLGCSLATVALLYGLTSLRNPMLPLPLGDSRPASILTTPRADLYFDNSATGRGLKSAYLAATQRLQQQGCKAIGLQLGENDWEYPFWLLLPDSKFQHVGVNNPSNHRPPEFDPTQLCAVISLAGGTPEDWGIQRDWQLVQAYPIETAAVGRPLRALRLYERQLPHP